MTDEKRRRPKMHSYTLAALLGIFIVAVMLAVASRLLPGRLTTLLRSAVERGKSRD